MKTEGKCNESVNNEFKIIKKRDPLHQIMRVSKYSHLIYVCLIIFLIHYFDMIKLLKSDKIHYILIQ